MSRSRHQRDKSMTTYIGHEDLSGKYFVTRTPNDFTNGRRGMARAMSGAKKFINSCRRFHERMALHNIEREFS